MQWGRNHGRRSPAAKVGRSRAVLGHRRYETHPSTRNARHARPRPLQPRQQALFIHRRHPRPRPHDGARAEAGADAVLVGRDTDSLARTSADIRTIGRQAWPLQSDVAIPEQCERACRAALSLGRIDILINNIGGRRINVPVEEQSWKTGSR